MNVYQTLRRRSEESALYLLMGGVVARLDHAFTCLVHVPPQMRTQSLCDRRAELLLPERYTPMEDDCPPYDEYTNRRGTLPE